MLSNPNSFITLMFYLNIISNNENIIHILFTEKNNFNDMFMRFGCLHIVFNNKCLIYGMIYIYIEITIILI